VALTVRERLHLADLVVVAGHFPANQRDRNHPRGEEFVVELRQVEPVAELPRPLDEQCSICTFPM
jgi:hypothetical protein